MFSGFSTRRVHDRGRPLIEFPIVDYGVASPTAIAWLMLFRKSSFQTAIADPQQIAGKDRKHVPLVPYREWTNAKDVSIATPALRLSRFPQPSIRSGRAGRKRLSRKRWTPRLTFGFARFQ